MGSPDLYIACPTDVLRRRVPSLTFFPNALSLLKLPRERRPTPNRPSTRHRLRWCRGEPRRNRFSLCSPTIRSDTHLGVWNKRTREGACKETLSQGETAIWRLGSDCRGWPPSCRCVAVPAIPPPSSDKGAGMRPRPRKETIGVETVRNGAEACHRRGGSEVPGWPHEQ